MPTSPRCPMNPEPMPSRRNLLRYLLAVPVAAGMPALSSCSSLAKTNRLDIASGEDGGMYFQFASLLSHALVENGVAEHSTALNTQASAQNLAMLAENKAELALALADTVDQYRKDSAPKAQPLALGRVYQNYFHCIIRTAAGISSLQDLAGRTIGTGAPGSGTWVTGQRILHAAKLKNSAISPKELQYGYVAGLKALSRGSIDALFLFGGLPVTSLSELASTKDLGLLDVSGVLPQLRDQYPDLYDGVVIPEETYRGIKSVETIGVGNLLMARADMPEELAGAIVKLLVAHADQLVPESSAGIQFLTPETLVSTGGQPLHPGAKKAYQELHG
ncbi:TAXI family TRAP transporter solute-binding subunit [Glutamicibacter sp.]|uniref:TAXI family TRAP transporter solute-binding subunit n=1 Tax=Glutamicibacter sp. TaxID=1931995 RepID=UPI003D6A215F